MTGRLKGPPSTPRPRTEPLTPRVDLALHWLGTASGNLEVVREHLRELGVRAARTVDLVRELAALIDAAPAYMTEPGAALWRARTARVAERAQELVDGEAREAAVREAAKKRG